MRRLIVCLLCVASVAACAETKVKISSPCAASATTLSPTGEHVAVQCKDNSVHLLALPDGKEILALPASDRFVTFSFSPTADRFAAGNLNGEIVVVPLADISALKRWRAGESSVAVLKFGSGTTLVAGLGGAPPQVWDYASTPNLRATLDTDFSGITAAAVSPNQKYLVTTGEDTVVRFYITDDWKKIAESREYTLEPFAANFTADGKYVAVGGADRQLTFFDPATGKEVRKLPKETDPVWEIQATGDQLAVLYMDADGRKPPHILLWNLKSSTSKPVTMAPSVVGGSVVNGELWMSKVDGNSLELVQGN